MLDQFSFKIWAVVSHLLPEKEFSKERLKHLSLFEVKWLIGERE
jgi:hypothetical protein